MKLSPGNVLPASVAGLLLANAAFATNPLIMDQFTADPTARVFEGKVYVYPSHDIKAPPGYKGKPNWFVMEDYHVFSSENLTDWKDHGVILKQTEVAWADPGAYAMWAPDSVYKDGKYYFYFPAIAKAGGFRIGVAIADQPYGPFKPQATPIEGVKGIDPSVLIDKDGSAYLYYSLDKIFVAKLKPNMREIEGEPAVFDYLPKKGLQEGPFVFERNGIYYLTYPHVANKTERLEYATATSPMGPFKHAGVILDEAESGCWTVHHSILDYRGQWYLFYHDKDLSPSFDKNRAIRADKLFFNADGTIEKVVPTLRGVGRVNAGSEIQIDRYSATSGDGIAVAFVDEANPHAGWKTTLSAAKSWVRFNEVDFGAGAQQSIEVRAKAPGRSALEIRLDKEDGPVIGRMEIGQGSDWNIASAAVKGVPAGVHDLFVTQGGGEAIEVDWVRFR
ncbi:family 43 glycosylhydrolase [Steroidobacter agaridevorans]|uniref:family 43 glycosylhydrolase n=1 Tax=Steroidobacter agaridevorans TaxID=2695856 RepID=UPI00132B56D0|nr:family 43 glycosylhydrolase [Steroidobacter agaridevorans]GFE89906.1 endo-1,4-beta-xylanase [Steroidobacter agaridevorans]